MPYNDGVDKAKQLVRCLSIPVILLDIVRHTLWLFRCWMMVAVVMSVTVIVRVLDDADILHLVHAAALYASLVRSVSG